MQDIYFTRHGETVWNVENKICGVTDIALTDRGREQARALGRQLAAGEQGIACILCSPLVRAKETRRADRRRDWPAPGRGRAPAGTGVWPLRGYARNGPAFALAKLHFADRFGGGESMLQLAARVYNLLDELAAQEDGPVLLVAHNGISRVVQSYFYEMTNEEFALFGIKNCELVKYTY